MIQGNLTKEEALVKMEEGFKITHEHFSSDEYIYMEKDGYIMSEDNFDFNEWWLTTANNISFGLIKPWRIYEEKEELFMQKAKGETNGTV